MVAAVGVFRNGRVSERSATDGCHTGCALAAVAGPPSGKAQAEKYRCPLAYLMFVVAAREDRDSNPGETFAPNGFQDRRLRPLGHPPGVSVPGRCVPWSTNRRRTRRPRVVAHHPSDSKHTLTVDITSVLNGCTPESLRQPLRRRERRSRLRPQGRISDEPRCADPPTRNWYHFPLPPLPIRRQPGGDASGLGRPST